jgi:hypothetical protein
MSYTLKQFGTELLGELSLGFEVVRISRWAHGRYVSNCRGLDAAVRGTIMQVVAMEEGPEFEMSESELKEFAERLVFSPANMPPTPDSPPSTPRG